MSDRLYITDQDGNTLRIDGATRVNVEPPRRSRYVNVYFGDRYETVLDEVPSEMAQAVRDAIHRLLVAGEGTVDLRDYKHDGSPSMSITDGADGRAKVDPTRSSTGAAPNERSRTATRTSTTMRALCLALALLAAAAVPAALAQESEAEVQTVAIQQAVAQATTATPLTTEEAFDTILDFGLSAPEVQALDAFSLGAQGNLALVRQEGFGVFLGVGNSAIVDQSGSGNITVLLQQGDGNFTSTRQVGDDNVIGVRLRGANNQLGTTAGPGIQQLGNDNVYLLDFAGDSEVIAPTLQDGSGNQVVQIGTAAAPFGVQQYGNGLRMIIRHNGGER
jgi:hypothetical protein